MICYWEAKKKIKEEKRNLYGFEIILKRGWTNRWV